MLRILVEMIFLFGDLSCILIFLGCFWLLVVGIRNFVGVSFLIGLFDFLLIVKVGKLNWWFFVFLVDFGFWLSVSEFEEEFMFVLGFCEFEERVLGLDFLLFVEVNDIEFFLLGSEFVSCDFLVSLLVFLLLVCFLGLWLIFIELNVFFIVLRIGFLFGLNFILIVFNFLFVWFFCNLYSCL